MNWKFTLPKIALPKFSLSKGLLGIDLGHRYLKAVQLERKGGHVVLKNYYFTDLATVFPDFPRERDMAQVLRALSEIHQLKKAQTATALSDEEVQDYELNLPELPRSEVKIAVQYELSSLSRIPESDFVSDFWQEMAAGAKSSGSMKLHAFLARSSVVDEQVALLEEAGFSPSSIESSMLANIEALRFNGYITERTNAAVIDFGEHHTTLAFVRAGALQSCRFEPVGSGDMNAVLAKRYGIRYSDSDALKRVFRPGDPVESGSEQEAMEEIYLRMFKFITNSIEAYFEVTPGAKLDSLLLVGGGASAPGVDTALQGILKVPAIRANPFKNIQIYSDEKSGKDEKIGQLSPLMTTAVGLALRNIA